MVTIRVDVTQQMIDWDGTTPLYHQKVVDDVVVNEDGSQKVVKAVVDALDDEGNKKPFTVRNAIAQALTGLLPSEKETRDHAPDIKDDIFRVMCLVAANDQPELVDDDRMLILNRAREVLNALLYGRIGEAFDAGEKVEPTGKKAKGKADLASVE